MAYPGPVYPDNYTQKTQVRFGGMNHQKSAGDGEWFQTMNLTSDYFPVMASREPRIHALDWTENGNAVKGMCGGDTLYWAMTNTEGIAVNIWKRKLVEGRYLAEQIPGVSLPVGEKLMVKMGSRLIVFPDKFYYDESDNSQGFLDGHITVNSLTFYSGTYMGEPATANCIQIESSEMVLDGIFEVGQGVTISGCRPENNITAVIREIEPFDLEIYGSLHHFLNLHFYDNTFTYPDGVGTVTVYHSDGSTSEETGYRDYTEGTPTSRTVERKVPDLDILFVHENRLWGAKGDTIWASALGDPLVWYNFDTVDTASWSLDVLSEGDFTGGCSFLGYPVFFKDNHIYKIYGSVPSDFSLAQSADIGVAPGSGRSLAIAGEKLYYLSRVGVMQYTGALPQLISKPAFGDRYMKNGVGGSDGVKYRITCDEGEFYIHHFVFDTQNGCWHEESTIYSHMAWGSGNLYCVGERYIDALGDHSLPSETDTDMQDLWTWYAESADHTESSPRRKWVGAPLEIRAEIENSPGEEQEGHTIMLGAGLAVYIRFDHDTDTDPLLIGAYFTTADAAQAVLGTGATDYQIVNEGKRSYICKQIPIRTDHYQLIIRGIGRVWIYSIAPQTEQGSSYHGKNGR